MQLLHFHIVDRMIFDYKFLVLFSVLSIISHIAFYLTFCSNKSLMVQSTDYEHQERAFFKNPNFLDLGRQIEPKDLVAFGFLGRFISIHFGTVSPLSILINNYFYKILSLSGCFQLLFEKL